VLSSKERAALEAIGRSLEREDPRLARQLTADPREVPGAVEPGPGGPGPAAPVPDPLFGAAAPAPAPAADDQAEGGQGEAAEEEEDEDEPPSAGPEIVAIAVLAVTAAIGLLVGLVAARPGYAVIGAALGAAGGFWWRSLGRAGHGGLGSG
jgi:hypothetical protein